MKRGRSDFEYGEPTKEIIDFLYEHETPPSALIQRMLTSWGHGERARVESGLKRRGRYHLVAWWKERDWLNPERLWDWARTNPSFSAKHRNDISNLLARKEVGGWSYNVRTGWSTVYADKQTKYDEYLANMSKKIRSERPFVAGNSVYL